VAGRSWTSDQLRTGPSLTPILSPGKAAEIIAAQAREAVEARGRLNFAVSGGHTPWLMLRILARETVPWERVHLAQVDERVASPADVAACRIDFANWLTRLPNRLRKMALVLATRETTSTLTRGGLPAPAS
jgi:hypothetical protein